MDLVDAAAFHQLLISANGASPYTQRQYLFYERLFAVAGPSVEAVDPHGAGDSMTAGVAAALARGEDLDSAVRLGAAAGGLNATRRGLATGIRSDIERLMEHVVIGPLEEDC